MLMCAEPVNLSLTTQNFKSRCLQVFAALLQCKRKKVLLFNLHSIFPPKLVPLITEFGSKKKKTEFGIFFTFSNKNYLN